VPRWWDRSTPGLRHAGVRQLVTSTGSSAGDVRADVSQGGGPGLCERPFLLRPRVRALACYLASTSNLPYDRMAQLFHDVLGIDVSTGALATMVQEAAGGLRLFLDTTESS